MSRPTDRGTEVPSERERAVKTEKLFSSAVPPQPVGSTNAGNPTDIIKVRAGRNNPRDLYLLAQRDHHHGHDMRGPARLKAHS